MPPNVSASQPASTPAPTWSRNSRSTGGSSSAKHPLYIVQGPHGTLRTLDEHPNIDTAGRAPTAAPARQLRHFLPMPQEPAAGPEHPGPAAPPVSASLPDTIPRGPLTADLERPPSTRPPVPTTTLRSLRTIGDLQSLLKGPSAGRENGNGCHAPSLGATPSVDAITATSSAGQSSAMSSASSAGPDVLTGLPGRGAGIGAPAKPQSTSNVVPGPSSRSFGRTPQTTATAASGNDAAPDGLLTPQPAAEEPESNTGVPVFCMMPLDTVCSLCHSLIRTLRPEASQPAAALADCTPQPSSQSLPELHLRCDSESGQAFQLCR